MLRKLLPHAAVILSGMSRVFFLIDRVNSAMSFINNSITKRLLLVLCAVSVIEAVWLIRDERAKVRRQEARAAEARRRQREAARRREEQMARRPAGGYSHSRYSRY